MLRLLVSLSPLSVSGAVGLSHIVEVTPEAPTLEAALGNRKPEERIVAGERELKRVWEEFNTATGDDIDIVALGYPHLTITEIKGIAALLEDKRGTRMLSLLSELLHLHPGGIVNSVFAPA